MKDNCLYYKSVSKNGKVTYTPCKVIVENSLYTGLYFVDTRKVGIKSIYNSQYLGEIYRIGNPKIIDMEELSGLSILTEDILEHPDMRALLDKPHSTYEVVAKTIAIINDLNKKKNNESNS
jgi:hypothetical protein